MGRMMILNGSPRASKSNSREFAQLLKRSYPGATLEYNLASQNHRDICSALESCSNLVFVFPLYVDCLPCCMLDFLSCLEKSPLAHKPTVHLIVNCGFLEPRQNEVAIDMLRLFCRKNGFPFGSSLSIGSGEAILQTPFALFVKGAIQKLARAISSGKTVTLSTRMPLSQKRYVQEAERYWLKAGGKNGLSSQQMRSTTIESKGASSQKA